MKNVTKNYVLEKLNYLDTYFALSALWLYSLYNKSNNQKAYLSTR